MKAVKLLRKKKERVTNAHPKREWKEKREWWLLLTGEGNAGEEAHTGACPGIRITLGKFLTWEVGINKICAFFLLFKFHMSFAICEKNAQRLCKTRPDLGLGWRKRCCLLLVLTIQTASDLKPQFSLWNTRESAERIQIVVETTQN